MSPIEDGCNLPGTSAVIPSSSARPTCTTAHRRQRRPFVGDLPLFLHKIVRGWEGVTLRPTTVNANPTKAFFVRMLTRDISLTDCVMDLIDNSVDGAWKTANPTDKHRMIKDDALSGFAITITFDENRFSISDNCGGITLENAAEYAFTFGRTAESSDYSVGVYGIGMKRAIFKLGDEISIHSTYESGGDLESFVVPINVPEWLADHSTNWDFKVDEADPAAQAGLTIVVETLHSSLAQVLGTDQFERELRATLARDYTLVLRRGLQMLVNNRPIEPWPIEFLRNSEFETMRTTYDDGDVSVELVAGMFRNGTMADPGTPDESKRNDPSGWYVACNGRVVLAADTTRLTGWGDVYQKWHPQYSGFMGFVLFNSKDPEKLPMTTTKRNVDSASAVYRRALLRMEKPARAWIAYTNTRRANDEEAAAKEQGLQRQEIYEVEERDEIKLPARPSRGKQMANINYAVPKDRVTALAAAFGNSDMTYRDVGMQSFEYSFADLVE